MHTINHCCRFNDCDPAGIMFYANIFTLIHNCYESLIIEKGIGALVFNNDEFAFPIIHSEADYQKPVRLHENITIMLYVKKTGENSFVLNYTICDSTGNTCVTAETVHVCINKQTGRKTGLPEFLKNVLTNAG